MNQRPLPFMLAGFVLGEVWIWQFQRLAAFAVLILVSFFLAMLWLWEKYADRGSTFLPYRKPRFLYGKNPPGGCALRAKEKWLLTQPRSGASVRCTHTFLFFLAFGAAAGGIREYQWLGQKSAFDEKKDGTAYQMEGQIEERRNGENGIVLTVGHLAIKLPDGESAGLKGRLLLYTGQEAEEGKSAGRDLGVRYGLGHRILFLGEIEDFPLPSNPGEFNQRAYQEGKGIFGCCYEPEIKTEWYGSFLIGEGLRRAREKFRLIYENGLSPRQGGLALAMALGDKSGLLEEQKELYRLGGISHVLAVSGLHMTLVGAGVYRLLRKMGFGYGTAALMAFPGIGAYAMLTGMSSSCMRASLMLILYLLGEWMGRQSDLFSSLALAGVWLLLEIPDRLFDSGFLLSFGALGGAGLFFPAIKNVMGVGRQAMGCAVIDAMMGSACISLFTLPLSLAFFHGFSVAGIVLNVIVIPAMSLLMPLLLAGGMFCIFPYPGAVWAGHVLLRFAGILIDFYEWLCRGSKKIPFGYMTLGYRGVLFGIFYYGILAGIFWGIKFVPKEKGFFWNRVVGAAALVALMLLVAVTGRADTFLTVLDVGQGDGILFHSRYGEVCLFDGGSSSKKKIGQYRIAPALSYYGIDHVDNWIISHTDEDHISGFVEWMEQGRPAGRLFLPRLSELTKEEDRLISLAKANGMEVYGMAEGDKLQLKEGTVYVLGPSSENPGTEPNENSLVCLLALPWQDILLTGDVEKEGEEKLTGELEKISFSSGKGKILKVAHHGSANATKEKFLETFAPGTALISCGKNNRYGHPSPETEKRLLKSGADIYRTDQAGAIEVRCKPMAEYRFYGK